MENKFDAYVVFVQGKGFLKNGHTCIYSKKFEEARLFKKIGNAKKSSAFQCFKNNGAIIVPVEVKIYERDFVMAKLSV